MRAVVIREFGGPEVLRVEDVDEPTPGADQVLVRVEVANLTFVETQVRAGTGPFPVELPMVPGNGVGGSVVALGDGVDEAWLGRRIVAPLRGSGGDAELAVADVAALIDVPGGLGLDEAVALLADGRTATLLVEAAEVAPGDRVLVEAAGGGVGSLLVQLCAAAGARVVGAASREDNRRLARDLGAELVVDYTAAGWDERVREELRGVDVVFDGVGGEIARSAAGLLGSGGRMCSYGRASGEWAGLDAEGAERSGISLVGLPMPGPEASRAASESALRAAADRCLVPVIGRRVPLEQVADAHRALEERRTTGKTLLLV